jgi:hypothetical protein
MAQSHRHALDVRLNVTQDAELDRHADQASPSPVPGPAESSQRITGPSGSRWTPRGRGVPVPHRQPVPAARFSPHSLPGTSTDFDRRFKVSPSSVQRR